MQQGAAPEPRSSKSEVRDVNGQAEILSSMVSNGMKIMDFGVFIKFELGVIEEQ
jgi:hypothetical protein